jgi:hypothetical protein
MPEALLPLIQAILKDVKTEFERLIEGVDVISTNGRMETTLHWAAALKEVC